MTIRTNHSIVILRVIAVIFIHMVSCCWLLSAGTIIAPCLSMHVIIEIQCHYHLIWFEWKFHFCFFIHRRYFVRRLICSQFGLLIHNTWVNSSTSPNPFDSFRHFDINHSISDDILFAMCFFTTILAALWPIKSPNKQTINLTIMMCGMLVVT